MQQKPLFYEDWKDAIRSAIRDSGKGNKAVAHYLWPGMKMDSAYARLMACLSDSGDQKLDFGEVMALMDFCGQYDPLYYACDESHHERPAQRTPEDEKAALRRQVVEATRSLERIVQQLGRLDD